MAIYNNVNNNNNNYNNNNSNVKFFLALTQYFVVAQTSSPLRNNE